MLADPSRGLRDHRREGLIMLVVVDLNPDDRRDAAALSEIESERDRDVLLQLLDEFHRTSDVLVGSLCRIGKIEEESSIFVRRELGEDISAKTFPDPLNPSDECPVDDGHQRDGFEHLDECFEG